MSIEALSERPDLQGGTPPRLTHSEFDSAVKDLLRNYTRPDLLMGNALLRARIVTCHAPGAATPRALRAFLAETAKTLFANDRDQKLFRVLDVTYLHPAPKQEAAADRLGMPFSTYRRHLVTGIERLTEWLWQQENDALQTEISGSHAADTGAPPGRPRLSIVILPFLNLSQDGGVDYLVDGIVDSLITDLSRALPGSFVISRSTAFSYKGRQVPVRQVGQELGVRYVLEGSVLADPSLVRVNVQLIDAHTDEHLWAERFSKERKDVLEVQDEIVARLSRSVGIEMIRSEAARSSRHTDAIDLVMRARALANDVKRKENAAGAAALFERALGLDPENVDALVGIATMCVYQVINLYQLEGRDALLDQAEGLIARAMVLAPEHIGALKARAVLLRARGRFADAMAATATVIARNPGDPTAYKEMGLNRLYLGQTQEAAEWFRRADSIAPGDPERWTWLQGLGRALMQLGDDAGAVDAFRQTMENNPGYLRGKAMLAAAEALAGNFEEAKRHLAEYTALEPNMTVRRFAAQRSSVPPDAVSTIYQRESERILEGLLRAGMPDPLTPDP
jgi:TolB-like protein/Flp pilus assembly protein TadD